MELLFITIALAALSLVFVVLVQRGRRIPATVLEKARRQLQAAAETADPHRKVLEGEKALEILLKHLSADGTFADRLRTFGPRFSHVQDVWDAHKLRNRIAHEAGLTVTERDADRALQAFRRAVSDLGG